MTSPGQHDIPRNLHSARSLHSVSQPRRGNALFESAVLGGFECSCHKLANGKRLDLALATRHEEFAEHDYGRLRAVGITAARDGVSWVRAERAGDFDFSGPAKISKAAAAHRVFVIWDLMHFGWPDDVDPFQVAFPRRFARYARAFARFL